MVVEPSDTEAPEDDFLFEDEPDPRSLRAFPTYLRHHLLTSKTPKVRMSPLRKR